MRLVRPEHGEVLRAFYGDAAEGFLSLLQGLASALERDVLPNSERFDQLETGIAASRRVLFDAGLCRMPFAGETGLSLPFGVYSLAMELAGAADAPTAMSLGIHNTAADVIYRFGSDRQRRQVFPELVSGRRLASFALTEASSGSDARAMKTKAIRRGSSYVLSGSKMFITNAGEADLYVVFAATEKGHAAFIVDSSTTGLVVGPEIKKLGMRASRTAEVRFEGCEVPQENLVGVDGMGFDYAKVVLDGSRIVMGSVCVGISTLAFSKAVQYSSDRKLFGETLGDLQLTRERIADMRTQISASRLLCMYASKIKDAGGRDYSSEAAQAKVMATETAARVCDGVVQIFGGYGYTDPGVHRHWRDARLLTIGEGASEVLRMLIAGKELAETR